MTPPMTRRREEVCAALRDSRSSAEAARKLRISYNHLLRLRHAFELPVGEPRWRR